MARIQVLELPSVEAEDGKYQTPFALIIDQAESEKAESVGGETIREVITDDFAIPALKETSGAQFVIITPHTLDVA